MKEQSISISRKQHDLIARLIEQQTAANRQLETACNTIMAGLDDEPTQSQLVGVRSADGVYEMVLQVSDVREA